MASPEPAAYAETAAPPLVDSTADRVRPETRLIALLALMHLAGFLAALGLPAPRLAHGRVR